MKVLLITPPTTEPIAYQEFMEHLQMDPDDETTDESLIAKFNDFITAAREHIEDITRRALLTQTWDYFLDAWPNGNAIKLPFGNLQLVTSVKWKNVTGVPTTLTLTTDYLVETNGDQCGKIVLPYGGSWPGGTLYPSNPITSRFVCGWTATSLVPSKIRAACKMIATKLHESRGEDVLGTVSEDKTVMQLLNSARLWDEF